MKWLYTGLAACLFVVIPMLSLFAEPYSIPKAELTSSDFGKLSGYSSSSSTLDKRTSSSSSVAFYMTLLGADYGKLGIGDPWPTNSAAGLQWDSVLGHYTSLADYTSYTMTLSYLSGPKKSDIDVGLFLNTGLTGVSGYPSSDPTNDTWWGTSWVTMPLGATVTLTLNFDYAQAYNISDNQYPHTGGGDNLANGGWYAINDRDRNEISNLGFQIADFDGDALGKQIKVSVAAAGSARAMGMMMSFPEVPEPVSMAFLGSAFVGVVAVRLRGRRKEAK